MEDINNVPVEEAAKEMDKSKQFVRIGIQRGTLPFGIAEQLPNSTRYTYYINPVKFYEFINKPLPIKYRQNKDIITMENPIIDWGKINGVK